MAGRRLKLPLLAFGLTFFGLTVFVALLRGFAKLDSGDRARVPIPHSSVSSIDGWRGPVASSSPEAKDLSLVFAPLHADAKRQDYDTKILTRRFGLGPGQPYRLEVSAEAGEAFTALWKAATAGELVIEDADGRVAELLYFFIDNPDRGVNPVQRSFDPAIALDAKSGGRLVFWGRPPQSKVRATGPGFEWLLTPSAVSLGGPPAFVASRSAATPPHDQ